MVAGSPMTPAVCEVVDLVDKPAGTIVHLRVLPGTIDTPANRRAMPEADPRTWVDPQALADAMLFLASPLARAVTGVALPVFGIGD